METRTSREKVFHEARFADGEGARPQDRFYVAVGEAKAALDAKVDAAAARGGVGLEIGCSTGVKQHRLLSRHSFEAHGIDISEMAIEAAQRRFAGADRRPTLAVMDAKTLAEKKAIKLPWCEGGSTASTAETPADEADALKTKK